MLNLNSTKDVSDKNIMKRSYVSQNSLHRSFLSGFVFQFPVNYDFYNFIKCTIYPKRSYVIFTKIYQYFIKNFCTDLSIKMFM